MARAGIIVVLGLIFAADAAKWGYEGDTGPDRWSQLFPEACAGRQQSPINIRTEETIFNPNLKNFAIFHDPPRPGSRLTVLNNGHAVQVNTEGPFYVSNGGLPHIYKTAQFHFHWGHKSHHGSEHTVNGVAAPIELHIVNWNVDVYSSIADAAVQPGGLAVLGILFEIAKDDNPILEPIVRALMAVRNPDDKANKEIPAVSMNALLPANPDRYYRYNGSLTTPGCFESVIWTVFHEKQTISKRQMAVFRQVLKPSKKHHKRHLTKRSAAHRLHRTEQDMIMELGIENSLSESRRFRRNLENKMESTVVETEVKDSMATPTPEEPAPPVDEHHHQHHQEKSQEPHTAEVVAPEPDHHSDSPADQSGSLESQMSVLDRMLVNNFRPVQPLNGRVVYRSFYSFDAPATAQTIYYVDMSASGSRHSSVISAATLILSTILYWVIH